MTKAPSKLTWMGEDIDALPREKLIEIIHFLACDLEQTRERAVRDVRFIADFARRAR